jgi:hypothetical protein
MEELIDELDRIYLISNNNINYYVFKKNILRDPIIILLSEENHHDIPEELNIEIINIFSSLFHENMLVMFLEQPDEINDILMYDEIIRKTIQQINCPFCIRSDIRLSLSSLIKSIPYTFLENNPTIHPGVKRMFQLEKKYEKEMNHRHTNIHHINSIATRFILFFLQTIFDMEKVNYLLLFIQDKSRFESLRKKTLYEKSPFLFYFSYMHTDFKHYLEFKMNGKKFMLSYYNVMSHIYDCTVDCLERMIQMYVSNLVQFNQVKEMYEMFFVNINDIILCNKLITSKKRCLIVQYGAEHIDNNLIPFFAKLGYEITDSSVDIDTIDLNAMNCYQTTY